MTKQQKKLLVSQAVKLTKLGHVVEHERKQLRKLVEKGIAYDSPEMVAALERFEKADAEWKQLEAEHLSLRL